MRLKYTERWFLKSTIPLQDVVSDSPYSILQSLKGYVSFFLNIDCVVLFMSKVALELMQTYINFGWKCQLRYQTGNGNKWTGPVMGVCGGRGAVVGVWCWEELSFGQYERYSDFYKKIRNLLLFQYWQLQIF